MFGYIFQSLKHLTCLIDTQIIFLSLSFDAFIRKQWKIISKYFNVKNFTSSMKLGSLISLKHELLIFLGVSRRFTFCSFILLKFITRIIKLTWMGLYKLLNFSHFCKIWLNSWNVIQRIIRRSRECPENHSKILILPIMNHATLRCADTQNILEAMIHELSIWHPKTEPKQFLPQYRVV